MIPKVNSSPSLRVVPEPRSAENDPGSSQGSGLAYESPADGPENSPPKGSEDGSAPEEGRKPGLRVVVPIEQSGMTEVLREFHENKKERDPAPGMSLRYQPAAGNTKGLLLNRKVE